MANPFALALEFGAALLGLRPFEAPGYAVLARLADGVEVRRYAPRLVAETEAAGEERRARGQAFGRLARYIFGGNAARQSIAMTAPVAMRMADGAMRMRFVLPQAVAAHGAPAPAEAAVALRTLPEEVVAVLRTRGHPWRGQAAREARLLAALAGSGWRAVGTPEAWFYDPPSTPGPLRRNEVAVAVAPA